MFSVRSIRNLKINNNNCVDDDYNHNSYLLNVSHFLGIVLRENTSFLISDLHDDCGIGSNTLFFTDEKI